MKTSTQFALGLILTLNIATAFGGTEKKLFTLEKNYHSDNIAVISTEVDEDCSFVTTDLHYYWLMGDGSRKEMHPLIRKEIKKRFQFITSSARGDSFKVIMNDLNELKHDLPENQAEIIAETKNGSCEVSSLINLGASGNHRKLNLHKTFCEVTKNALGIPNGCKFLDLIGVDADSGEKLSVRFYKK